MSDQPIGVVLMAYGTPRSPAEILPYYTDIRRGRVPTDEQLADLTRRYEAIGGVSPLAQLTEAQRDAIQAALDEIKPGGYEVVLGLKHADPKIETTVDELAERGFRQIVGAVLAPHYSAYSIGQYIGRVAAAAEPHDITVSGVESWAIEPAFIDFMTADVETGSGQTRGCCSPLTRSPNESWPPAIPTSTNFARPLKPSPNASG
jgi:ferrochelatase